MNSPHRLGDPSSGLVIDTHGLARRAGTMQELRSRVEAPSEFGNGVIEVAPASPVDLDLRLESAVDGVLVTGSVGMTATGQCARCLTDLEQEFEVDVQELFLYPGAEADDEEASRIEAEQIDLEPLVRDMVVLDLPYTPLCRPDCAGLCPECGADLNQAPQHSHGDKVDPRWAELAAWDEQQ